MKLGPFSYWFHALCALALLVTGALVDPGSDVSICRLSFGVYIMGCLMHPESRAK